MKSKKAMAFKVIMAAILILAIGVVFWIFLGQYKLQVSSLIPKEICKQSVNVIAMTKIRIAGFQLFDSLGNTDVLKCSTKYYDNIPSSQEKQYLANAMYDCWDQFGEGKKEIFDTKTNNYCVICSRLDFKNKGGITQFTKYLMETNVPAKKQTYFEFLNAVEFNQGIMDDYENSELSKSDNLDTSPPLAVVFVMGKKVESHGLIFGIGGVVLGGLIATGTIVAAPFTLGASTLGTPVGIGIIIAGAAAFGATGAVIGSTHGNTNWDAKILLWPYDDISQLKQCKVLEGSSTPLRVVQ